jgi:hypothetical protein
VERFDGQRWRIVRGPEAATTLTQIRVLAADESWAIGELLPDDVGVVVRRRRP